MYALWCAVLRSGELNAQPGRELNTRLRVSVNSGDLNAGSKSKSNFRQKFSLSFFYFLLIKNQKEREIKTGTWLRRILTLVHYIKTLRLVPSPKPHPRISVRSIIIVSTKERKITLGFSFRLFFFFFFFFARWVPVGTPGLRSAGPLPYTSHLNS